MPGIWHNTFNQDDMSWQITTASGLIYKTCPDFSQSVMIMIDAGCEPDQWEAFIAWQRHAGRRCMEFARMKLHQKRQREK